MKQRVPHFAAAFARSRRRPLRAKQCAFALLAMIALSAAAWAEDTDALVSVNLGFNNQIRADCWTPALVTIRATEPAARYEIVATNDEGSPKTWYHRTVFVPAVSSASGSALIRVQLFLRPPKCESLTFELRRGGVAVGAPMRIPPPLFIPDQDLMILGINPAGGPYGFSSGGATGETGGARRVHMVNVEGAGSLPQRWAGYDAVHCLLMGGLRRDTMSESQQRAIVQWVERGGLVILTPGEDASWLSESLLAPLCPVEVFERRNLYDRSALAEAFGSNFAADRPLPVWESHVLRGDTLLAAGDLPLIVTTTYGAGRVVFLGFDASEERMRSWPGLEGLYKRLFDLRDPLTTLRQTQLPRSAPELLNGMVGASVPRRWLAGLFLAVNVGAFLIAFAVFRRRRRREWAWLVLCIAAPVFALVLFAIGASLSGVSRPGMGAISVHHGWAVNNAARQGGRAPSADVTDYVGVISPQDVSCDTGLSDDNMAFPALLTVGQATSQTLAGQQTLLDFADDDVKWLRNLLLHPRLMMPFEVSKGPRDAELIEGEATPDANGIKVRVRNRSSRVLHDAFVALNRNVVAVGRIEPGAETTALLTDGTALASPKNFRPSLLADERGRRRERIIGALFSRSFENMRDTQAKLYGWIEDEAAQPLEVKGISETISLREETLWIVDLPWGAPHGGIRIPRGAACASPDRLPVRFFRLGEWEKIRGSMLLPVTFRAPDAARGMSPTRLAVYLTLGGEEPDVKLKIWNTRSQQWQPVEYKSGEMVISNPQDFLSPRTGEVKLILEVTEAGAAEVSMDVTTRHAWIEDFDVSIEGSMP